MGDFLRFRRMLTPLLIEILFWVGLVACEIGGVLLLVGLRRVPVAKDAANEVLRNLGGSGVGTMAAAVALMIFGPVAVRLFCESLILMFRINETLTDIKNIWESRLR
jgi:hypothetical protein